MAVTVGIIAVGGKGSRLGASEVQKCLIPVGGRPIVEYVIDDFVANGISLVILLTGFLHEQIDSYLADRAEKRDCLVASVYGGIEGEAAAIYRLRYWLKQDFLYAGGDVVFDANITSQLIRDSKEYSKSVAIMSVNSFPSVASTHPAVAVVPGSSIVTSVFQTKADRDPASNLVSTGMYYFRRRAFRFLGKVLPNRPMGEFISFALAANAEITVSVTDQPWFCLHTQEDLTNWPNSPLSKRK